MHPVFMGRKRYSVLHWRDRSFAIFEDHAVISMNAELPFSRRRVAVSKVGGHDGYQLLAVAAPGKNFHMLAVENFVEQGALQ